MSRQWQEITPGKYSHNWIIGLFAEVCKSGKYLIFQTTSNGFFAWLGQALKDGGNVN